MSSYAVVWKDDSSLYTGKLELEERRLRLEGISREGRACSRTMRYDELDGVHMAPGRERIGGRPTLVVERSGGEPLRVGSVDGRGFLPELADQLTARAFARLRAAPQAGLACGTC
jgi:hypothetical protein